MKPRQGQKWAPEKPDEASTDQQKTQEARRGPRRDPGVAQERPRRAQEGPKTGQEQRTSKVCTARRREANFSKKVHHASARAQVLYIFQKMHRAKVRAHLSDKMCTGPKREHHFHIKGVR